MKTLVITGTGQLGYTITKKALAAGHQTYALYRESSDTRALEKLNGVQMVKGDLTDQESLENAVKDMEVVIGCATSVTPSREGDALGSVDQVGYLDLLEVMQKARVSQFIYTSAISHGDQDKSIPLIKIKRQIEDQLKVSGLTYTIYRPAAFMDISFAFMGTDIVLNGTEVHTLNRPYVFAKKQFNRIRKDIEVKGQFNFVGRGDKKVSFIALEDVANFHVNAINNPGAFNRILTIGGPEALSVIDVKKVFEKVYEKPLKGKSIPAPIIKIAAALTIPFWEQAGNIMAMTYASTRVDTIVANANAIAEAFNVRLTSVEEFIRSKKNQQ